MNVILVIVFAITLIYFSITERFIIYATLIAFQGVLLFVLSLLDLLDITLGTLLFVTIETLLFKVVIVPVLLVRIIRKTGVSRVHEKALPGFYSLLFISAGLILSIIVTLALKIQPSKLVYFVVALFAIYTGLFLIISHRKIFSHLIGFLVIENAVLLLSLAIGSEMPMLINIGILLDIFVSVLILGIFLMRLKQHTHELTLLKDD